MLRVVFTKATNANLHHHHGSKVPKWKNVCQRIPESKRDLRL